MIHSNIDFTAIRIGKRNDCGFYVIPPFDEILAKTRISLSCTSQKGETVIFLFIPGPCGGSI